MNILTSIKRFLKNKNTVTILGVIAVVAIIFFGYNNQLKTQTNPISVPVAKATIQPRTLITSDMITYISIPRVGVPDNVVRASGLIVGKYSNYNTVIPEGSMFYTDVLVEKEDLPNSAFTEVAEGDVVYNLKVTTASTYGNSMFPGDKIDIYLKAVDDSGQIMVGKLIENVEIVAVKDASGRNVFEDSSEARVPAYLIFGVSPEIHILLRKAEYMTKYSTVTIPVPHGGAVPIVGDTQVSSTYLKEFINSKTVNIPIEDIENETNNNQTQVEGE